MGFGKEDGEEFGQVEVALVPLVELHVPDEFVVSGHVVVSDHAPRYHWRPNFIRTCRPTRW